MPGWLRRLGGTVRGGPVLVNTPDTESLVFKVDLRGIQSVSMYVKNIGSNSAVIRITSSVGGIEYDEVVENVILAGDVYKLVLFGVYDDVRVYARSATAGSPTTLKIAWVGVRA